jgi:hypothetical protein
MRKRYILLLCLVLVSFMTCACWLDDDGTRLDGTDGDAVIDAIPNAPVDPRLDTPQHQ